MDRNISYWTTLARIFRQFFYADEFTVLALAQSADGLGVGFDQNPLAF